MVTDFRIITRDSVRSSTRKFCVRNYSADTDGSSYQNSFIAVQYSSLYFMWN
jgi:hypothetical protein